MSDDNPYQSSQVATAEQGGAAAKSGEGLEAIANRTFLAWEKLRLVFNGVLIAWTLFLAIFGGPDLLATADFWTLATFGGIVVNICYFAGPIVETYVTWLGFPMPVLRWVLFFLGTLVCAAAATLALGVLMFEAAVGQA